jgi:DNA-binding CsgD family transcriptional regulator
MLALNEQGRERTSLSLPARWQGTATSDLGVPEGHVLVVGLMPVGESALTQARLGEVDFSRGVSLDDFMRAIRQLVTDGGTHQADGGQRSVQPSVKCAALTSRERQVMGLIGQGMSNKEIAKHLDLAIHTVKTHVHNVLAKLGVRSRLEVAVLLYGARGETIAPQVSRVA